MKLPLTAPGPPRSPWQLFYGGVHRLRASWYGARAQRLPRPVVSIGNLHWGGTGKTPMVAAVAAHLRDGGRRVAILSRGYRGEGRGVRLVSDGEGPLLGPRVAGDEPVLLAGLLPGVAVVVDGDRHRAGLHALERLDPKPDLFLLDDGFSHLSLARDLDILLFPAADPFAGGRLPPSGRLREPLASSARADAAVLTGLGAPRDDDYTGEELARTLRPHGFAGPGFVSRVVPAPARFLDGREVRPGARVLIVSGIGRPLSFLETVRRLGFEVADHLSFSDHHDYPAATLEKIAFSYRQRDADLVLTTGKDMVKLQGRLDLPLAELPIRAEPDPSFFTWLDERLAGLDAGRP